MFVGRLAQAWRLVALALLPFALLGCSFAGPGGVFAQEPMALAEPAAGMRIERPSGYEPGDSLGFRLRDTSIAEQVFRRDAGGEHGLVWTAQFTSRWPTTPDQLDRWSAQAIGHLTDGLGTPVRLDGWERLSATDLGEQRVAYRYRLADVSGSVVGEATIVVFARGEQVGLTGSAAVGTRTPVDATALARALDVGAGS